MANAPQLTVGLGFDLDEASAKKVVSGMDRLNNNIEQSAEQSSKKTSGHWSNTFANMLKGFIAVEIGSRAFQFGKDLLLLEERFNSMQLPLKNLTEKTGDFGSSMFFLKGLANTLGQDIFTLSEGYKNIYASGKQAGMSTMVLNNIFESIIRSGSALKLSNEKIELSLKAVEQMMNKGTIGSEELKQQLGDHLPGAFSLMAKAAQDAGISITGSTQELIKLMEEGKVGSTQVLPFFAKRMEEAFGKNAEANVNTLRGSANRLKNELTFLVSALDDSRLTSFWASFQNGLADVYKYLTFITETGTWKDFIGFFAGGNIQTTIKMVGQEGMLKTFSSQDKDQQDKIIKERTERLRNTLKWVRQDVVEGNKVNIGQLREETDLLKKFKEIRKGIPALTETPTTKLGSDSDSKEQQKYLQFLEEAALKSRLATVDIKSLTDATSELNSQINKRTSAIGLAKPIDNTGVKKTEKEDLLKDIINIYGLDLSSAEGNLKAKFDTLKERIKPIVDKFSDTSYFINWGKKLGIDFSKETEQFANNAIENYRTKIDQIKNALADITYIVSNSLGETFSGLFESVFDKDVKFDFKKVLSSFLKAMGQMAIAMGSAILSAGLALTGSVFGMGEGAKSIASGIGLIALGGALTAGGSVVGKNTSSPSQSKQYDSTFTAPAQGLNNQSQKVEFVIQGTTLKGVLNNVNNSFG